MKHRIAIFVALCAFIAPAFAAEPYVVGMLGIAKVDLDQGSVDAVLRAAGATNLRSSVNDTPSAVKIGLGFKLTPKLAAELSYVSAGDFTYQATFTQGSADVKVSATGYGVSLLGFAPLDETVSLYARLGLFSFTVDSRATIRAAGVASASFSGNSLSPEFGAGVEISLTPTSAIRAEYDFFSKVGDQDTTGKSDVSVLSVGFLLRF
jgi:OOP family OmpA-OmpF porin